MTVGGASEAEGVPLRAVSAPDGAEALWRTAATTAQPRASAESVLAARAIASSSGRRTDTPVRKGFVRSDEDGAKPPLARLYAGGRSGTVAIKLYLALIWRCSGAPFQTAKPTRAWATLLDLPDPDGKGARRVGAGLRALADLNLLALKSQAGQPNLVTLLDENGKGRPYRLPSTSHARAKRRGMSKNVVASHVYFKVSSRLWLDGYIQSLSGPGLVMLLILLAEQAGEGASVWFSTSVFRPRYGISHQTRAAGTAELVNSGLLNIQRESVADSPRSSVFDQRRMRNVYQLRSSALVLPNRQAKATTDLSGTASPQP